MMRLLGSFNLYSENVIISVHTLFLCQHIYHIFLAEKNDSLDRSRCYLQNHYTILYHYMSDKFLFHDKNYILYHHTYFHKNYEKNWLMLPNLKRVEKPAQA
ncbi:MAG: hypothetical protein IKV91_00250 [Bacteroidales bacterium]|nr:hypothetical protein [Bacteroidales bacterium]